MELAAAKRRKFPAAVGWVTETLDEMARAVEGMPQTPPSGKVRARGDGAHTRAGPPQGPAGLRVSTARHGATV